MPSWQLPTHSPTKRAAELDAIETSTPDLERQIRAATTAVETEETEQRDAAATGNRNKRHPHEGLDTEDRERLELRSKVRMSSYIVAAVEQRAAIGPEHEYNAALGISGNRFPLELLAPPEQRAARTEERAITNVDVATMPRTWLDRLFAETAAMELGVTMESVPSGQRLLSRHHGRRLRCAASTDDRRGRRRRMDNRRKGVEAETERRAASVLD